MNENGPMHWIAPIPDFDLETYPYILCSGNSEIWIANVKESKMYTLITGTTESWYAQPGMSFIWNKDPYAEVEEEKKDTGEEEMKEEPQ